MFVFSNVLWGVIPSTSYDEGFILLCHFRFAKKWRRPSETPSSTPAQAALLGENRFFSLESHHQLQYLFPLPSKLTIGFRPVNSIFNSFDHLAGR
jgi:hypothetical protein